MKTVLLISDSYPPEVRSASHLMQELAFGLRDRGFNVFVATSYPQYNLSEKDKDKVYKEFSEEDGIKVIRIKTLPHHKVNFIIRGIAQLTMPYIILKKILKYINGSKFNVRGSKFKVKGVQSLKFKVQNEVEKVEGIHEVIVYSPPLPLALVGKKIKKIFGAKYLLNIQDLFPQNAIDLGILTNPFLIKFFEQMEKKAYKSADVITFHSEGNLSFVSKRYKDFINKFKILHNWIDVNEFEGVSRTNKFRNKYGLKNKLVLLFAGVMGPSQGLDFVINLAQKVQDLKDITFLFVGDGMEKENLEKFTKESGLNNVVFKPFVSKSEYPELVKDCDVGLVSLTSKNKTPVVPGKILGYMAAGIPILAFLNQESDGHKIIKDAQCGYSSVWGKIDEAEKLLRKLYSETNRLNELGNNGFKYVKENFDKEKIVDEMLDLIFNVR